MTDRLSCCHDTISSLMHTGLAAFSVFHLLRRRNIALALVVQYSSGHVIGSQTALAFTAIHFCPFRYDQSFNRRKQR